MTDRRWWRPPPRARRRIQLSLYALTFALAVSLTIALATVFYRWPHMELDNRLSAINDVFAGGALLLSLAAGIIALQALAATGPPSLTLQVWFGTDRPNRLVLVGATAADGRMRSLPVAGQNVLNIRVRNDSKFDASNLVVLVYFRDLAFGRPFGEALGEWRVVDAERDAGAVAAEWVSTAMVHRTTTRRLPSLDLEAVTARGSGEPRLEIFLACAGYVRPVVVNVEIRDRSVTDLAPYDESPEWL
jgi:hypothetical protein